MKKFGYVLLSIPIIVLIVLLFMEIKLARTGTQDDSIAYKENSSISYKVHMKENSYGIPEYVDENYNIIASLVDFFNTDFKYVNTFSSEVDYEIKYNVKAQLMVYDSLNDQKPIYTNEYTIINDKVEKGKGLVAKVDLLDQKINYDEYIRIVNELKREIIPTANLVIKFNTSFKGTSDLLPETIQSDMTSSLTIPVSQKTINIDLPKKNNSKEDTVVHKKNLPTNILIFMVTTVLLLLIFIVVFVLYAIRSFEKKSKYDLAVNKILREFDRAITESSSGIKFNKKMNKIIVKDFMELLDVHDNFNIPIIYHKLSNKSCEFMVKNDNDIYYYQMKDKDFK